MLYYCGFRASVERGCQYHKTNNQRITKGLSSDAVVTIKEKNTFYFEDDLQCEGAFHAAKLQRCLDHTTITDDAVVAVQHDNLLPVATGNI